MKINDRLHATFEGVCPHCKEKTLLHLEYKRPMTRKTLLFLTSIIGLIMILIWVMVVTESYGLM